MFPQVLTDAMPEAVTHTDIGTTGVADEVFAASK
jgi:hypothetical protein